MRKTQMALAAVALVASTAAMAQVTVYGNADGSMITGGGTTSFDGGGGYTTSLFGLRGSEDLGGGLKASFNLESAVNLGNGGIGGGGGGNTGLFNRAANVSLGNDMVGLTFGNQLSIVVADSFTGATAGAGDNVNVPAVVRLLGNTPGNVVHGGAGEVGKTNPLGLAASPLQGYTASGFFIPDAVTLRASAAGLTFKAQTRLAKNSTTSSGYTAFTVSGAFDGVNVALGQQQSSGLTGLDPTAWTDAVNTPVAVTSEYKTQFIALNTKVGDIGLNGAWANNTGLVSAKTYMFGASYPLSEAASVGALYTNGGALGNQTSFNLKYSLSKSTVAYVTTSMFSTPVGTADGHGTFSNTGNGAVGINAKNVTAVGVSHSF